MVRRTLEKFICQCESLIGRLGKSSSTLCVIFSNTLGDETSAGG